MSAPRTPKKKILVGISGGSNSAVTAALLKSQGYEVHGVHLTTVEPPDAKKTAGPVFGARCCLSKSAPAAEEVCRKLDIPLKRVDVSARFEERVIDGFVHDLLAARTPCPCVPCNLDIRFGTLIEAADQMGCELVGTGHHAQVLQDSAGQAGGGSARLSRAVNTQKDQSYFLFGLQQKQLARLLFPLGGFQDAMIQRLAAEFELPVSSAGNPQDTCFFEDHEYVDFFEARVAAQLRPRGAIKMTDGAVMGEHLGIHAYRLGQKVKLASHVKDQDRYQVVGFDLSSHALLVGQSGVEGVTEVCASRVNWIRPMPGLHGLRATARVSARQAVAAPCRITHFENRIVRVQFDEPQAIGVTGAPIVFYDGEEVLGGAFIDSIDASAGTMGRMDDTAKSQKTGGKHGG